MEISKNTKLTISISTIVACVVVIWQAAVVADEWTDQIIANSESVAVIAKSLRLNTLGDQIGDLKRERRQIKEKLVKLDGGNSDLENEYLADIETVDEEIDELEKVYDCVLEGNDPCG